MNDDLRSRLHALGDSPDLRRPLADLDSVLRRTRRRRIARAATTGLVATLVVAGSAAAVPRLTADPAPAADGIAADAPATCRLTPEQLSSDDAGPRTRGETVSTAIDPTSVSAEADGSWRLRADLIWTGNPTASYVGVPHGWTYGSTVAVLRQGAIVAVLDTFPAPTRAEAAQMQVDVVPAALPLTTEVSARAISCATGETALLEAGEYQVVVSTTAGLGDSETHDVVRATSPAVDVTIDAAQTGVGAFACGTDDSGLRSLADPRTNPAPLRLEASGLLTQAPVGARLPFTVDLVNDGVDRVVGTTGVPRVVVTRDGVVVGGEDAVEDIGYPVDLEPGASQPLDAATLLRSCTGDGSADLPPGDYELWAVASVAPGPESASPGTIEAAGGPWSVTLVAEGTGVEDTLTLTCGMPDADLAARSAATGDSALTLTPAPGFRAGAAAVVLTNEGSRTERFWVETVTAAISRDGVIADVGPIQEWDSPEQVLAPGESQTISVDLPDGTQCDAPAGTYDAWAAVTIKVADGPQTTLVTPPRPVTLP